MRPAVIIALRHSRLSLLVEARGARVVKTKPPRSKLARYVKWGQDLQNARQQPVPALKSLSFCWLAAQFNENVPKFLIS
jgi:hypothetical protein